MTTKRKKSKKKKFRKRPNLHGLSKHAFKKSLKRCIFLPSANSLFRAVKEGRATMRSDEEGVAIIITKDGVAAVVNPETKKVITTYKVTTTNKKGETADLKEDGLCKRSASP